MKSAIVIGGSNGLGCAIVNNIKNDYDDILIVDIVEPLIKSKNIRYSYLDLSKTFDVRELNLDNFDSLIITAGIGFVKRFCETTQEEIQKIFDVNCLSIIKILKSYFDSLLKNKDRKCFVMGSIAGLVTSPLNSIYGSSKAGICSLCESLNIELERANTNNRITLGIACAFSGSSFFGGTTELSLLDRISKKCISAMNDGDTTVYLDDVSQDVIKRYYTNKHQFGLSSYDYKVSNNRIATRKIITVGYLSGTFDLFHIGHLNLLKRAKQECDYLIVGVHESGAWKGKETFIPFDERVEIIKSIKYVDEVHKSLDEDCDAWDIYHYDKLFVGDDYKGSDRFLKYENYFLDKGVQIIYFPYTKGTSSTKLREKLSKK